MNKTASLLEIEHLSVSYDGERSALDDFSLTIKEEQIISLVGESGSGKSTFLHAVLGLLPRNCSVSVQKAVFEGAVLDPRHIRGQQIAIIFQNAGRYMDPTQTIGTQYRLFLKSHGKYSSQEVHDIAVDMFEKMRLSDPERVYASYPFELSGGMCQRAAIAMAMTLRPKLLLADEPTSALDVTVQSQVIRQMEALRDSFGTSIILVTHNMGVAAHISDEIGVMQAGRLVETGSAGEVIRHPQNTYTRKLLNAVIELEDKRLVH